ncbi:TonB-dependent receptor [Sphingomonas koreensis]|nr:TonB-dependent receptor [Sphingomonas koreensis]
MNKMLALGRVLLATSAIVAPGTLLAQTTPGSSQGQTSPGTTNGSAATGTSGIDTPQAQPDTTQTPSAIEQTGSPSTDDAQARPDISVPGGEIVVLGRRSVNIEQATSQVVSVLSSADIARTGEGDIAGALSRVTGLSVVGNGYVYVRGLGDRYSLALLNGLPLPSPEPLKRVVPLDIFPTNVIDSSLVQKTYSANFPGEFGGGVINLTTVAAPKHPFLTIGGSVGGDSFTTGNLGYTYYGSPTDWTGFDNGQRNAPPALKAFLNSGKTLPELSQDDRETLASQLVIGRIDVVQRNDKIPVNWAANVTAGNTFDLGGASLGLIATAGYSNKWQTRDTANQTASTADLSSLATDYRRIITDNHVVVDGLLGAGLEFGENKIRWTNLFVRDTLKDTRLAKGETLYNGYKRIIQNTAWYERQLIDSQLVGEFKFGAVDLDTRLGYANSKRNAPYESEFGYSLVESGPYAGNYVNVLDNQSGNAAVSFSKLNENLWSGGLDITMHAADNFALTAGAAYTDQRRTSSRREFDYFLQNRTADGFGFNLANPGPVSLFRPDYLLEPTVIQYYNVDLSEPTQSSAAFEASLRNNAAYLQGDWHINDALELNLGARYEHAVEQVDPLQVFDVPVSSTAGNRIDRDYLLPAATLTWQIAPAMQLRFNGSKTIARPQFRELLYQRFYDPDTNRDYYGNPYLIDSQLYNVEGRYEWYFARDQHVSLAVFAKRIDHPIEQYLYTDGNTYFSSFANAPKARLYGAEAELQKYFDLANMGGLFSSRRAVLIANYTYSHSRVSVAPGDTTINNLGTTIATSDLFQDARPLTGQSNHVANLQIGLEDKDRLSQQTFILSYASKRLTDRGPYPQPDVYEYPGLHLDFVARQGITIAGIGFEAKLDIRNITGTKYKEYQQSGSNRTYFNLYDVGTSGSIGLALKL